MIFEEQFPVLRYTAAIKIGNSVISLLWQLRCSCNPDHNKFSSSRNTTVVAIFPKHCLWRRSLCSNLGGIHPEKLYRATLIMLLQMLFFTAAILLCAVRDGQCKTSESPQSGFHLTVERDWFWFWFWFYYALWLVSVFTLVLVLRQSSENRSKNVLAKIDHQVPAPSLVPQGLLSLQSLFLSIFYTICVIFGNSWQLQKSFKIV